ncbi:MAG TPA: SpoIID/LytB domain-containing protein, partial [Thermoanaerobaculia bacterium]|nr:SpoIID/LytB domain-containing protein [Thermoanaerobaculia bacterium]
GTVLLAAAACASRRTSAPAPGQGGATAAARPSPPSAIALPPIAPPVLRIGLSSDVAEFALPAPGAPWIVSGGGETVLIAGPVSFRALGGGSVVRIQTGAFSEEATARAAAADVARRTGLEASVAFSAEKGLYRVRAGTWPDAAAAQDGLAKLHAAGIDGMPVSEPSGAAAILVRDGAGRERSIGGASVDVAPGTPELWVVVGGKPYRGRVRLVVNPRGALNVVNVVNVEDYLRGVVPAEMGPKRFDEIEALKAQAVAARTYAIDNADGFAAEGYDLCATPKCQVYGGIEAEDPLTDLAVEQTRGRIATFRGKPIHALFTSTCGGATEDARLIFPGMAAPYLAGVICGEQEKSMFDGARVPKASRGRVLTALEWRGWVLERLAAARRGRGRAGIWEEAFRLAGFKPRGGPPASLSPGAVYPAVLAGFGLADDRDVHLTKVDVDYAAGPPDPAAMLAADARAAYETISRLRIGDGAGLPAPSRTMSEAEFGGLLFSVALRLGGVVETTGRLARRDGGAFVVKTPSGRVAVPAETTIELARGVDGKYYPASEIALTSGDAVGFWKRGTEVLAFWAVESPGGGTFEKESSWTEWVRRVPARVLAQRLGSRLGGTEVRSVDVRRRGRSGRVVEAAIATEKGSVTLSGFDIRQALELPELIFTVEKAAAADGSPEFLFVGRGWGHGVGLCQNGAYGMALAGSTFEEILKHYYSGIDVTAYPPAPPSGPAAPPSSPPSVPPAAPSPVPPAAPPPAG